MDEAHPLAVETPYAAAKAAADLIVRSYARTFGLDTVIVRPFNTYGPRQNERQYAGVIPIVIRRILSGLPPIIFGDGEQTRDYTFVTDIVAGIVAAARHEGARGRVINLATGEEVTINRLVQLICQAMGYEGRILHGPPRAADVRRHRADVTLARSLLGWVPAVSLEEGIARTVAWYRERMGART
jgi:UDP-glucose 4-epimerase